MTTSNNKVIKLDLDNLESSNEPVIIQPIIPAIKKKKSSKPKKEKTESSTSIIDSILKKKTEISTPPAKKKLILNMNDDSNSHIISEITAPEPDQKGVTPLFINAKPAPTITLKCEQKKKKDVIIDPLVSQKLDTVDSLLLSNIPISKSLPDEPETALIPTSFKPETPLIDPPKYEEIANAGQDYSKLITELNDQIKKVQHKIQKKGADAKYTELLAKLEAKRAKYARRLAKQSATTESPKPKLSPPANKPLSAGLISEIDIELNKTRDILTNIEQQTTTNELQQQQSKPEQKVIREAGLFAVPTELASMKEKKEFLRREQEKLRAKLEHRQKQIDKIKHWQREVEKMDELQKEKHRIYQLQQDLKKLEKQQYEQDQYLKRQMYNIKKQAHQKSNELKRLDMIYEAGVSSNKRKPAIQQQTNKTLAHPASTITQQSPVKESFLSRFSNNNFFNKLGKIMVGERVFFNNKVKPNVETVEPMLEVDNKSGLTFFTVDDIKPDNKHLSHETQKPEPEIKTLEPETLMQGPDIQDAGVTDKEPAPGLESRYNIKTDLSKILNVATPNKAGQLLDIYNDFGDNIIIV